MSTPYRVESYIPIPPKYDFKRRYPWRNLQIGQSFFVPSELTDLQPLWNTLSSSRRHAVRKTGWKFTMRQTEMHGVFGIRIWRVS